MPLLDPFTLFAAIIATSILWALCMSIAVGMQFRDGVGKWTASLILQVVMCVFYGARGRWPDLISIVIPNALFALMITLQAAAILEFYGKRLSIWWHVLPVLTIALLYFFLLESRALRVIFSGVIFGTGFLLLALIPQRFHVSLGSAKRLLICGYALATLVLYARAGVTIFDAGTPAEMFNQSIMQTLSFLICIVVIQMTCIGFLSLQKERAEEAAQNLAVIDPLTGALNRRTFLELTDKEIARAQRTGASLALIMLDVDHFKKVNDRYGHQAGDAVLTRVVDEVQACLRREDLLVRYGGEEFCILLPNIALDHAMLLAERARAAELTEDVVDQCFIGTRERRLRP